MGVSSQHSVRPGSLQAALNTGHFPGNREDASDQELIDQVAASLQAADLRGRPPMEVSASVWAAVEILERRLEARGAFRAEEESWDSALCRARRTWAEVAQ